jgi:hypothetical protein
MGTASLGITIGMSGHVYVYVPKEDLSRAEATLEPMLLPKWDEADELLSLLGSAEQFMELSDLDQAEPAEPDDEEPLAG